MELETSGAEEAGEHPIAKAEEKKPKKRSNGFGGHEIAHYSEQVNEEGRRAEPRGATTTDPLACGLDTTWRGD